MNNIRRVLLLLLLAISLAAAAQPAPRDADVTINNVTVLERDYASQYLTVSAQNFDPNEEFILYAWSETTPPASHQDFAFYFALTAAQPARQIPIFVQDNYTDNADFEVKVHVTAVASIHGIPVFAQNPPYELVGTATILDDDLEVDLNVNGTFDTDDAGWGKKRVTRVCNGLGDASDCSMELDASTASVETTLRYTVDLTGILVKNIRYLRFTARYKTASGILKARTTVRYKDGTAKKIRPAFIGTDTGGAWTMLAWSGLIDGKKIASMTIFFRNLSTVDKVWVDTVTGEATLKDDLS